jgi:hypothetical protein
MNQQTDYIDVNQPFVGPCLKGCGNEATYQEINHENQGHRVICPACGPYPATIEEMEDKNIV